ncbi:MAG: SH3 domain-containing protein [Lachnospiraceae bacterium]|nr:SH3 domain-containing protein [Lachnospiraceae bacterium]
MNRKALRFVACCMTATVMLSSAPLKTNAATPVAGIAGITASALEEAAKGSTLTAGVSQKVADYVSVAAAEASVEATAIQSVDSKSADEKPEYADIAIAQVDNYVNVRDAATEEGEVVGKLYNNSAATVHATENGWYQITSGNVTGYVKSEFVVCGDEELAKQVSRRVATVQTETLFVRAEPTTESDVVGMVPLEDDLTVVDESVDGWKKVSVEGGEGYVSNDYIAMSTEFVTAESKAEEEARLAREEAERKAAAAAAAKATKKSTAIADSSAPTSSGGSAVANYACQFVGNPYVYGGTSLTNGADCSGFVMAVYAAFGVGLPHSSSAMRGVGYGVSTSDLQPGDIICYSGHVAIYVGNNTIVHASTPATGIKYTSPINYKPILAVRRIF